MAIHIINGNKTPIAKVNYIDPFINVFFGQYLHDAQHFFTVLCDSTDDAATRRAWLRGVATSALAAGRAKPESTEAYGCG
jgi:hypothetical protein